jgi:hypothetical protein
MKHLTVILIIALSSFYSQAQINEIGVFLGGSNFIGDVGATNYIAPNKLAIGGIYKWNRSKRHSYRFSLIYTELEGKDGNSDDPSRLVRGYEFKNEIIELSAGMEFTFLDFDLHRDGHKSTPYLYTGISIAKHDNFFFSNDKIVSENTSSYAYGIPMAIGYKSTLFDHFIIALEIGARYTFSDEIDGSEPDAKELKKTHSFGNINNTDWYTFTGVTLTYTFGRNPCYCN